jgi:hypothetical protein
MPKPTKITLSFSVYDDDPLKKDIFEAFSKLMKLLDNQNKGDEKNVKTKMLLDSKAV